MTDDARRHPYTKEQIRELRRLNNLSAKTRGSDPADSPRRLAGNEFVRIVEEVRHSYDPPLTFPEAAADLGINHRTLRAKVARRVGGDLLPPSQKKYTGQPYNENKRTRTKFSCGHPRVKGNSYWNKALQIDVCIICQKRANAKSREAKETKPPGLDHIEQLIEQEASQ